MQSSPESSAAPDATLSFLSLNDTQPTTIVLLHGACSCQLEFAHIIPFLSDYHLIIPDLPCHSASRAIKPATVDNSATHVARLIRSYAHEAKAHVVGVSMGGQIAQRLALAWPSLVMSLFVSGASPFSGWTRWLAERPTLVYGMMALQIHVLPDAAYWWLVSMVGLKRHEELLEEMRANCTWETMTDVFKSMATWEQDDVAKLRVRTISVAGGKGDDVEGVREMGQRLKVRMGTNGEDNWPDDGSGSVVVKEAIHAWDLQFPEVFANGVISWVRGDELPAEYERL